MIIGVPKEIKADDHRVAITPAGAEMFQNNGHQVVVETRAGQASGFEDDDYAQSGAQIVKDARQVFEQAQMLLRVKEPQVQELALLKPEQIYFSFLHLAASRDLTDRLMGTGACFIGYETIERADGILPLLKPMSQVAGPMAIQEGAKYLEMAQGGHGVLLGGVPGVEPATVVILGGGGVGLNAAKMACGLGAKVYVLEIDLDRMRYLSDIMPANCFLMMSSPAAIRDLAEQADLMVGAALVPGSRTPVLVTRDMLPRMKPGAVLVDVSIDQGGCFESSHETTHQNPIYTLDGVVHYAVSNMPGALPRTSTIALTNATLPYALEIANKGWRQAIQDNPEIRNGANVVAGKVTHHRVAETFGIDHAPIEDLL